MLLLQFGNMSKDLCRYNTKLFAEQVMPKLKDVHAEWEDRWWPQPMDSGATRRGAGLHAEAGGGIIISNGANRERTRDVDRRRQRLCHPHLAQGQRPEARLPGRLRRLAALDAVPRRTGEDRAR